MGTSTEQPAGPDLRQGVLLREIRDAGKLLGTFDGEAVLLVWRAGEIHAVGAVCTHYSGPLQEGLVVGNTLRCPWHHACFDLRTGAPQAPALNPIACYDVVVENELVSVIGKRPPSLGAPVSTLQASAPSSIVIVGAGAAGHAAAEALRNHGYASPITLLGADPAAPVDRPNLSKDYLAGNAPFEWIPLRPPEFFAEQKIQLLTGQTVAALHPREKQVALATGERVDYGALLLATGAAPVRLPIPGADLPHVFTLRTLADADRIIAAATGAKRAVVIGASFIGLEAAASLRTRGLAVAVVGPEEVPLERVLGRAVGEAIRKLHEGHGVTFHLGRKPATISTGAVTLDNGSTIEANLVIMGVGVRPTTSLAEKAGLKVDNGILVDAHLQTSHPGIYAAGDAARFPSPLDGEPVRIEHWQVAQRQGQAAARNMLGENAPYKDIPFFWSAHYDKTIRYTGVGAGFTDVVVNGDPIGEEWTAVYRKGDRVVAVATLHWDLANLQAEDAFARGDQVFLRALIA